MTRPYHHKGVTRGAHSLFRIFVVVVVGTSGSPRFTKKCLKSWLAQRSSGGPVTLLSGTSISRGLTKTSYIFEKDISTATSFMGGQSILNLSATASLISSVPKVAVVERFNLYFVILSFHTDSSMRRRTLGGRGFPWAVSGFG